MKTLAKKSHRLLTVRPNVPLRLDEAARIPTAVGLKRILVPVDFSGPSLKALRYAARLAEQFGSSIELLYVAEIVVYFNETVSLPGHNVLEEMKGKLTELARNEVHELIPVYPHIATGKPFNEIVQFARDHATDLIVIGTHGRTGMEHLLLGSTAERVVRHAPCPVLVVRAEPGLKNDH